MRAQNIILHSEINLHLLSPDMTLLSTIRYLESFYKYYEGNIIKILGAWNYKSINIKMLFTSAKVSFASKC